LPVLRSSILSKPAIFPGQGRMIFAEGGYNIKTNSSQPTHSGKDFAHEQEDAQ
jgi:hypothetical protein